MMFNDFIRTKKVRRGRPDIQLARSLGGEWIDKAIKNTKEEKSIIN